MNKHLLLLTLLVSTQWACRKSNQNDINQIDNDKIESRAVHVKALTGKPVNLAILGATDYTLRFTVEPLASGYAAKVTTAADVQVLDASTWGYPMAYDKDVTIDQTGFYNSGSFVLGTSVGGGGQFEDKSVKYLGFRGQVNGGYRYGWVSVEVPKGNGNIIVHVYAIMNTINEPILTGQTQ